jgi:hypothetical protein
MNFELFLIYGNEYGVRRSGSFQATKVKSCLLGPLT